MPYNENIEKSIEKTATRWKNPGKKKMFGGILCIVLLMANPGCGSESPPPQSGTMPVESEQQPEEPAVSTEETFAEMENTLLNAETVRIVYRVSSHGAFETSMEGELLLQADNRARLEAAGTFSGNALNLHLLSDGRQMRGGCESGTFALETPPYLNEGILIGITRMGLLHNLAKLSSGQPPDRTDGTVREWVQVSDFSTGEEKQVGDMQGRPIVFQITVSGDPVGEAMLWIDPQTGMPVQRFQKVYFGTVEMHVSEEYEVFSYNEDMDPAVFQDQNALLSDSPAGMADNF